ncbi:MAG: hypothetical protein QXO12_02400 [Candidatus Pacearchaeota archaeon]
MSFECEECGRIKPDEEKNEVIDSIRVKFVCSDCIDTNRYVILKEGRKKETLNIEIPKITFETPKINVDDFKRMLKMERIKRGLSVEELAKILEINSDDLKNFERGYKDDENIKQKLIEFFKIKEFKIEKEI